MARTQAVAPRDQNALGDAGLGILLNSQVANRLELLSISQVGVTSSGLKWLASSNLNNLRQLLLYCNKLGKRGLQFLAKSLLPQLKQLDLLESELTNQSIKSLSKAEWPNLKELDISSNKGITCDFLGHLEEVNWRLQKMRTSLTNRLSIRYFSSVVRPSTGIHLEDYEMVEGKDTFFNAKIILSQFVEY